ncbi:MAG: hypothetical protein ACREQ5_10915, partial [Candidatus Dormibacteria bacterium]
LPRIVDVMVASIGGVANTGIVFSSAVPKRAAMNYLAVRWRVSRSDAMTIYFHANVPFEQTSLGEAAIARPDVEHRYKSVAVLLGQLPEESNNGFWRRDL